jgi:hypothetical protein
MALIEAIVLGALAGVVVESGKRGLIKSWRERGGLPPVIKVLTLVILAGAPAIHAGSFGDFIIAALATVGAFTVARWSVASLLVIANRLG